MDSVIGRESRRTGKHVKGSKNPKKRQLSLAERITEFRMRKLENEETNVGMADSLPQDLFSLIGLYREIIGVESRLTSDVVRSISSIRNTELPTRLPDIRLQKSKPVNEVPRRGQDSEIKEISNGLEVKESSEMTQLLLTPREPEVFKTQEDLQLIYLTGPKQVSIGGKVLQQIESSSQDHYPKRQTPTGSRRSRVSRRKLIVDATKSRGGSGFLLRHITDSADDGCEAVLDTVPCKSNTASSSTQVETENLPTAAAERSGSLLPNDHATNKPDQIRNREKLPQRSGYNIIRNLVSTKKKLAKKKYRKYGGYSKRSTKSMTKNRRFHFVGQSLKRSFSLPSLNDGLFHGGMDRVKTKRYYDIEQIHKSDKPFAREENVDWIKSQKRAGSLKKHSSRSGLRPKEQRKRLPQNRVKLPGSASTLSARENDKGGITLPSIHGNRNGPSIASTHVSRSMFKKRPYLRSRSCGELEDEKGLQRLVPRFLALYKDIKALDTLSTENNTNIRMKVKATNNQNSDLIVTWGTKPEEVGLQLFTRPSYMFDEASVYKAVYGRKKKPEIKKNEDRLFLYPREISVVGFRNDVQSVSSFMGKIPKAEDVHDAHERKSVYHRNCCAVGALLPWRFT